MPRRESSYRSIDDTPEVSVVVVNHNAGRFLESAIRSVLDQVNISFQVLVVDNASTDGSTSFIDAQFEADNVALLRLDRNVGFSAACNVGIVNTIGRKILFLNPDCLLREDALRHLSDSLDSLPDAGIVGPLIVGPDDREQAGGRRDIPTPFQTLCALLGLHRILKNHPRFRHFNHVGTSLPAEPIPVQSVSGACMMVARESLDTFGTFDESYFLHFEDLDLCYRFMKAGKPCYFVPGVVVKHFKGASGREKPIFVHWHKHRSMIKFFDKNFYMFYPKLFLFAIYGAILVHFVASLPMLVVNLKRRTPSGWDTIVDG